MIVFFFNVWVVEPFDVLSFTESEKDKCMIGCLEVSLCNCHMKNAVSSQWHSKFLKKMENIFRIYLFFLGGMHPYVPSMCMYVYTYICVYIHMRKCCLNIFVYACVYMRAVCKYVYLCVYIYIYTSIYILQHS